MDIIESLKKFCEWRSLPCNIVAIYVAPDTPWVAAILKVGNVYYPVRRNLRLGEWRECSGSTDIEIARGVCKVHLTASPTAS